MPTYEYVCKACGEHLEVVQSFKDAALTECPACHGELRKVFSAAGIIFKGSGWHVKDYAASGSSKDSAKDSSGSSDSSADTSSDKSAKTTDAKDSSGSSSEKTSASKAANSSASSSSSSASTTKSA